MKATFTTLTPAYGRDYKTAKEAMDAFDAGKDFVLNDATSRWHGKPCSKRDFPEGADMKLRYNGNKSLVVFSI